MKKPVLLILFLLIFGTLLLPALAEETGCAHTYTWLSDETSCWQQCSLCGNAQAKTPHREFCPGDGFCDSCGHAAQSIAVYHAYSIYAGCDENGHFVQCIGCGNTITEAHYGACQQDGCEYAGCEYTGPLQNSLHNVRHAFGSDYSYSDSHHWQACPQCGHAQNEAEHKFVFSHVMISTCQELGYDAYKCVCGAEKRTPYTQPGTHIYDVTETPPSCEKKGSSVMVCVFCGDTLVDTFPALNHAWDNYNRDLSTCTKPGMTHYKCSLCGDYLDEILPPLTHQYDPVAVADVLVKACRHCGKPADDETVDYLLLYCVKPDRYGSVRLNIADGWTAESYADCRLVLIYADGTQASAPFVIEDSKVLFSADGVCTAAFVNK